MTLALLSPTKRHDVVFLAADRLGFDGGVSRRGRPEEAVRHHPDLELLRPRRVGADDDRLVLRLLADDRLLAAAARRVLALHAHAIDARGRRLEIDRRACSSCSMNFGHGELGFGAWPSAKSKPVAEYCTVFSVSTPIAFDASAMTVLASCAEAVQVSAAAAASTIKQFLNICHHLSLHEPDDSLLPRHDRQLDEAGRRPGADRRAASPSRSPPACAKKMFGTNVCGLRS